jgi:hypothetical protein
VKRLVLVALLLAGFVPAASRAGACSPLDCSPSQFTLARGSLLAVRNGVDKPLRVIDLRTGTTRSRLPAGVVSGNVLVHQDGSLLTWYSLTTGARLRDAVVQQHGAFQLVGLAQNGREAVLARTKQRSTTFAVVSPTAQRIVKLGGNRWTFDALNGDNLFLVRYLKHGYQIRLLHLASGALEKAPLQDRRARRPSGARRGRVSRRRTVATCSRCMSARTAARWCTCSTRVRRPPGVSTSRAPAAGTRPRRG